MQSIINSIVKNRNLIIYLILSFITFSFLYNNSTLHFNELGKISTYLSATSSKFSLSITSYFNLKKENKMVKQTHLIERQINDLDYVVFLDEKGKSYSSIDFSKWLNLKISSGNIKCLKLIIGGPYGHSKEKFMLRVNEKISFSKMTFSHQMIRIFVLEQIYRSLKIIYNEPYHNE